MRPNGFVKHAPEQYTGPLDSRVRGNDNLAVPTHTACRHLGGSGDRWGDDTRLVVIWAGVAVAW